MSTGARRSLRLRSRPNAADPPGEADNDASVATARRTALGNISNREEGSESQSQQKSNKPRPSGAAAERARRGPTARAREPEAVEEQKPPAKRRSTSRRASARGGAAAAEKRTTTTQKRPSAIEDKSSTSQKKAGPAKKREGAATATAKRGGGAKKRSSNDGGAKEKPRPTKRTKKSDTGASSGPAAVARRRSTRSHSASSRKRKEEADRKAALRRSGIVEVVPAGNDGSVVPSEFGLIRDSFDDGRNFTYGIAHYDAPEREDPLRCKGYVTDMFQHLYHAETTARPRPYMDRQEDINEKMRAILVDWLVEVHMKFRLVPETLYLCVHIIDRYCSIADIPRSKLQLVGVTALFLACKHEEIYPPEVRDCVYITDRAYDRQEVLDMEQTILRVLDWKISLPTAYPFLDRFLGLVRASEMTRHAAAYYLERTLQEHDLLDYRPSLVCAAAVVLALNNPDIGFQEEGEYHRDLPGLPQILMEYTAFDKDELMECMAMVAAKVCEPAVCASRRHLTAVRKKYEHRKYLSVSSEVELPSVRYVRENMSPEE
ncbi:hypothetical protein ACHAWF_014984 [Thalassiosira exigua]